MLKKFEHIVMTGIPRIFPFPFQISAFGYATKIAREKKLKTNIYRNLLEICVRLSSEDAASYDEINGVVYQLPFPHVIVKIPGVPHRFCFNHSRKSLHFMYEAGRFDELTNGLFMKPPYAWPIKLTPTIRCLVSSLKGMARFAHKPFIADKIDISAFSLLEALFVQKIAADSGDQKIFEMSSYLQNNYKDGLTIDSISDKFGISTRTFFRNWKQNIEGTPHQYLSVLRMNEAKRLLLESNMPIAEIAKITGFNDSSYFIHCFRKTFHETPLHFRKVRREKICFQRKYLKA